MSGKDVDPNQCAHTESKVEWPYVKRCKNQREKDSKYCAEHSAEGH